MAAGGAFGAVQHDPGDDPATGAALSGSSGSAQVPGDPGAGGASALASAGAAPGTGGGTTGGVRQAGYRSIPGLGPAFASRIPADSGQVLLVSGAGKNANTATATLWTRGSGGTWTPGASWPARNALDGWTTEHELNDLRSPIGVYSLTAAGGLYADPGTKLPYTHSSAFKAVGTGFEGESLAGSFDYVVAIDYNHVPGSSPLDTRRPLGASRGGGIWVHVDHGGPTHGCVALPLADMRQLLLELDPARHPVIAMGDATSLDA